MGRGQAQVADHFSAVFGDRRGSNRSEEELLDTSAPSTLVVGDFIFMLAQIDESINASATKASINMYRRGESDIPLLQRVPIERGEYGWWHSFIGALTSHVIGGQQFSQEEIDTIRTWIESHEEGN